MSITAAQFRKGAKQTWSGKHSKPGLRQMLRKNLTVNVGYCTVGIASETSELLHAAQSYLLGQPTLLDENLRAEVLDEVSDLVYFLTMASVFLKIKLPSILRKRHPTGTPAAALLHMSFLGNRVLSKYKKVYYGQELDLPAITELVTELVEKTWDFIWLFFEMPVAEVMAYNNAKLLTGPKARFKGGAFDVKAIEAKDAAEAKKLSNKPDQHSVKAAPTKPQPVAAKATVKQAAKPTKVNTGGVTIKKGGKTD